MSKDKNLDPLAEKSLSQTSADLLTIGVSCLAHRKLPMRKEGIAMNIDYAAINLLIAIFRLGLEIYKLYRDTKKPH